MYWKKLVTKDNFTRAYIMVLNGLLQLTPREIDVLNILLKIDLAWQPRMTGDLKNLLSTDNRRLVMKEANIAKANLTRTVKKLLGVGVLEQTLDDRYIIPELMRPIITYDKKDANKNNKIFVTFILDLNKPTNEKK